MPRNSSGVYSKPAGTTAVTNTTVDPSPWNGLTTDLGNEITNSLPRDGSAPMLAPLQHANGTQSQPAITFASDTTTGFYHKGAGIISVVTNGAEIATLSASGFASAAAYSEQSGNLTATSANLGQVIRFTASATATLTAAASLGSGWRLTVIADGGDLTITPTSPDLIDGWSSLIVPNGRSCTIYCNGAGFRTDRDYAQLAGFRNLLMNPDLRVNGRGYVSGTVTTAANQYSVDRWRVVTLGQSLTFAASGNGYTFTAPAGGLEQVIEAANIRGGAYVLNWSGNATATVNGTAVTAGTPFTLTANANVTVRFTGGTVTQPQLEYGNVTAFEQRPISVETALCQRFYERFFAAWGGDATNSAAYFVWCPFKVTKRVPPSIVNISQSGALNGGFNVRTVGGNDVSGVSITGTISAASGPSKGFSDVWYADAEF
ncbi:MULTISPECIES: hypothetical protein [unclassified Rhizobium]|uniref:hypothetical protein n=1 Tax=unclassified Rhizobium TaxID=2613769 RepID=UPI00380019DA